MIVTPFSSPPDCYSRFDLISLDRTMWGSGAREVLIQYFTLCDQMSMEMVRRRNELMGSPPNEKAKLVTFDGSIVNESWKVAHCNEVLSICKRELGLATSPFYSSHNDISKTFGHLGVNQPVHTPMRNTFWDVEMTIRLAIDTVRDNRKSARFLLPKGGVFPLPGRHRTECL